MTIAGMRKEKNMNKLENWVEITKGIYRYIISANAAYEIHLFYWDHSTDILSSNCSLFIVGDWRTKDGKNIRKRECLLDHAPLSACISKAVEDDKENNN